MRSILKHKYYKKYALTMTAAIVITLGISFSLSPHYVRAAEVADCPDGTSVPLPPNKTYAEVCKNHMTPPATTTTPKPSVSNCNDPVNGCATQCKDTANCVCDPQDKSPKCAQIAAANRDCNKNNGCDLIGKYLNPAINLLSAIVGIVVVVAIMVGGIQYSSAGGDPQKVAAGRSRIAKALIGLIAYLLFYAFLQFIIPGGRLNG